MYLCSRRGLGSSIYVCVPYVYMVWEDIMYVSYAAKDGADDSPGSIGLVYNSVSML